jgi:hypothetical protein
LFEYDIGHAWIPDFGYLFHRNFIQRHIQMAGHEKREALGLQMAGERDR